LKNNPDKAWVVYVVKCKTGSYYTGITSYNHGVDKRIEEHNSGKGSKYCAICGPVEFFWSVVVTSKSKAAKLEYAIKKMSNKDKADKVLLLRKSSQFW
jgi:putative endonuclease